MAKNESLGAFVRRVKMDEDGARYTGIFLGYLPTWIHAPGKFDEPPNLLALGVFAPITLPEDVPEGTLLEHIQDEVLLSASIASQITAAQPGDVVTLENLGERQKTRKGNDVNLFRVYIPPERLQKRTLFTFLPTQQTFAMLSVEQQAVYNNRKALAMSAQSETLMLPASEPLGAEEAWRQINDRAGRSGSGPSKK